MAPKTVAVMQQNVLPTPEERILDITGNELVEALAQLSGRPVEEIKTECRPHSLQCA